MCPYPIESSSDVFAGAPWGSGRSLALSIVGGSAVDADLSFDRLAAAAARRAQQLVVEELAPGQVVACNADPGLDFCVMQYALARVRAVLLPLDPGLSGDERGSVLESVSAEWSWSSQRGALIATGLGSPPQADRNLAVLIRTSGSTGEPRVAMVSASNVLASSVRVNLRLDLKRGDQWLCCLPLHSVGGLAISYRCALAGACLRLHSGFDPEAVAADLDSRPISHLSLVPPMLSALLRLGVRPCTSLRVVLVGGQALDPGLARRAVDAGWPVYLSYGMSETFSMVATARPAIGGRSAPIWSALPDVALDTGPCVDEARALRLRGPMVMAGYGNRARRAGDGLVNGWLHTRDLGCRDRAGGLQLLGRTDDVLVIGGVQVVPAKVESRLAEAPGIDDLVVVAVPNVSWGATLALCYTGTIEPDVLTEWCRKNIVSAERPRIFVRYPRLPQLPGGKTDRLRLLRDARKAVAEGDVDDA